MRIAVIDLGTNTCNLLIAEFISDEFQILHQSKHLVKLGDDKMKENEIGHEATVRTLEAFRRHKKTIEDFGVDMVRVIATSAIRTADNKISFLEKISEETGWIVKVVSGEMEAELIFKGVLLAFKSIENPALIVDIGGGSNELILCHQNQLLWKESCPTGMARICNGFQISDPVMPEEIATLQKHFLKEHKNAVRKCLDQKVENLIGCAGAFDTLSDLIDDVKPGTKQRRAKQISIEQFNKLYQLLIGSRRSERLEMKGMDLVRVDLIVPAVIFIRSLVAAIGMKSIVQTDFALREGVLYDKILAFAKS